MVKRFLASAVFLGFCAGFGAAPASAQGCLSLGEARQAVQSGLALPLRQLRGVLGGAGAGEVVSVQLCRNDERLTYRISVLGERGEIRRFRIDAQSGTIIGR